MMKQHLEIKGFKCFSDTTIELNDLTVLVGANGYGKSSTIQSLLLLKQAVDNKGKIKFNDVYDLRLGFLSDIINQNYEGENMTIKWSNFDGSNHCLNCDIPTEDRETALLCNAKVSCSDNSDSQNLQLPHFYYLSAERQGPRISQPLRAQEFPHVGTNGESSAQIIAENEYTKVDSNRIFEQTTNKTLSSQVESWMRCLFPEVTVNANRDLSTHQASIKVGTQVANSLFAPNIGFGISYVLPIIVSGLIAQTGSYLIVENPEAHLHPSAQTSIGCFLARVAMAGVRVIVETHSDHLIDGIQLELLKDKDNVERLTINNYGINEKGYPLVQAITMNENGDYSNWPTGFMDQTQLNYMKRLNLQKQK